jgi:hypothetical protein
VLGTAGDGAANAFDELHDTTECCSERSLCNIAWLNTIEEIVNCHSKNAFCVTTVNIE